MSLKWSKPFYELIPKVGLSTMPGCAYDTAWYARLIQVDEPLAYKALDWLRAYQLPDGTWGAPEFYYAHDRIISTLSAMTALGQFGNDCDKPRIERAKKGLGDAFLHISQNSAYEMAGFEVLAPSLMAEAEALGLLDSHSAKFLPYLAKEQKRRLKSFNGFRINNKSILAYSAEMAGDNLKLLDLDTLQMDDGSVFFSPAATSYYYLNGGKKPSALAYLETIPTEQEGAMPNVYPFAVFEQAWTLWNLALVGELDATGTAICAPLLDALQETWDPVRGTSFTYGAVQDGDDSSLTFEVLKSYGRSVNIEGLLSHFVGSHMRCYQMEANPSISTNIHALSAFRKAGFAPTHPIIQKVLYFLKSAQNENKVWLDKWHISPYYTTCHAIIAASNYTDWLVETAISWLTATQHKDGSWGTYLSTAEETAFGVQALAIRQRDCGENHLDAIQRGAAWLIENHNGKHPPLWVGKVLYSPTYVNDSAVYSALCLAEQVGAI
ncbi:MAG: hypothetical protein DWQ04_30230 [Chloroflexi bacterium]|nr:MAG: hypothetical protein DWQ04_30230 [Chloroflexota bacterium]